MASRPVPCQGCGTILDPWYQKFIQGLKAGDTPAEILHTFTTPFSGTQPAPEFTRFPDCCCRGIMTVDDRVRYLQMVESIQQKRVPHVERKMNLS